MSETVRLRGEALEWREIEGEIVALDRAASEYLAVNRTGAALWPLLQSGATKAELADRLVESFEVDHETAGRDVESFLEALEQRGLLAE